MRPAFSVVFLTTLIGAGQGLYLALFAAEVGGRIGSFEMPGSRFFAAGSAVAVALCAAGLLASFFHLGRPERAWRSAAMWRTSWLSREVIALPVFMAAVSAYGSGHHFGWGITPLIGVAALVACFALFVCTAMIYACIRFLQEWASPYTIVNFFLLGCASGFMLAVPLAAVLAPPRAGPFAAAAIVLTVTAFVTRMASLVRNARIVYRSSLRTAIGAAVVPAKAAAVVPAKAAAVVPAKAGTQAARLDSRLRGNDRITGGRLDSRLRGNDRITGGRLDSRLRGNDKITQVTQGFTGNSFNTTEFFHGVSAAGMGRIRMAFIVLAFIAPVAMVIAGLRAQSVAMLAAACLVQYAGLVLERWYFLAQSSHAQNLYYQSRA